MFVGISSTSHGVSVAALQRGPQNTGKWAQATITTAARRRWRRRRRTTTATSTPPQKDSQDNFAISIKIALRTCLANRLLLAIVLKQNQALGFPVPSGLFSMRDFFHPKKAPKETPFPVLGGPLPKEQHLLGLLHNRPLFQGSSTPKFLFIGGEGLFPFLCVRAGIWVGKRPQKLEKLLFSSVLLLQEEETKWTTKSPTSPLLDPAPHKN